MKELIKTIRKDIPFVKERILGAVYHPERANLWPAAAPPPRGDEND